MVIDHVANNVGSNHIKLAIVGVRPEMEKAAAKGSAEGPPNVLLPSTIGADSTTAEAETSSHPSSVSAEDFQKWYFTQVGLGLAGARRIVDISCAILRIAQVSLVSSTGGA
jgi:hypothetical protein